MEKLCHDCGEPLTDTAKFCKSCGTPIPTMPVQPAQQDQQPHEHPISSNEPKKTLAKRTEKKTIQGVVMLSLGAFVLGLMLARTMYLPIVDILIVKSILILISFVGMLIGLSITIMNSKDNKR